MPEGPEIRLAADKIANALVDRKVERVDFAFLRLRKFSTELDGHQVTEVNTRGKAILTCFDNGLVIYSHNQLYGRWYVCRRGQMPQTGRQLRLSIRNREFSALLYSASEIDVLHRDELDAHPFLARIGPDILNDAPDAGCLVERLRSARFRKRQFAGLLLDQGFVAGLGNYLRAEILTVAGLHPLARPADCSAAQLRKLASTILTLTRRSYRTRGIVNPPSMVKRLRAQGLSRREEYRFNTYGRAGMACFRCGSRIELNHAGGRKMYFCPGCQGAAPPKKAGRA